MNIQNKNTIVSFTYGQPDAGYFLLIIQIGYFHPDFIISLNRFFAPKFTVVSDYLVLEDRFPYNLENNLINGASLDLINRLNYIEINPLFDFFEDFNHDQMTERALSLGHVLVNCWNALLAEHYPDHQAKAICGINPQSNQVFVTLEQGECHDRDACAKYWAEQPEKKWVRPNSPITQTEESAVFVSFNEFQVANENFHITDFDYMYALLKQAYVHPDFLGALAHFYWPELIKREGLIFLGTTVKSFDETYYQSLEKEKAQYWMNVLLFESIFPVRSSPWDDMDLDEEIDIAKSIVICWNAKLKQDWPNEKAKARMMYDEELTETYLVIDDYLFKSL
jgi:hypothetical protein